MNYLHYEVDAGPDDTIEVALDRGANVLLLDNRNYQDYRNGRPYRYYGGLAEDSLVTLWPPHRGPWHVVVNLGGYPGTVRASVSVRKAPVGSPR